MVLKELHELESPAEKLAFVKANKTAILKAKKGIIKRSDSVVSSPKISKATSTTKNVEESANVYRIIGNSAGFLDSHMDVSMPGSYSKSIQERGNKIPILVNHDYNPKSIFALNKGVAVEMVNIRELGYDADGMTEAVLARIEPKYDAQMNQLYADGQIKEHSIGLRYVKLELCINDDTEQKEFEAWQKHIDQVINRDLAKQYGYFFAVTEQKIEEISAVVFGSNPYTPTLDKNYTQPEPPKSTQEEPETPEFIEIDLVELYKKI